jgi:AraC-like DNA-binding protein
LSARVTSAASARGVDVDALCRDAGVDPRALEDIDAEIDAERHLELWACAMDRIADPAFPIEAASDFSDTHNLLRFVCMSCENIGDALERASRYMAAMTKANRWLLIPRHDGVIVRLSRNTPPMRGTSHADLYCVAELLAFGRVFSGVDWAPLEVSFAHAEPADSTAARAFFGVPVRFSAEHTELVLSTAVLATPLLSPNASARDFFIHLVEKRIAASGGAPASNADETELLRERVRRKFLEGFCGEAPAIEDVASELGVSGRTLRRRLEGEGTTYQRLLDETRFALAQEHLARGPVSHAELAFVLGFSEASAFHRAFRRWTGTTPRAYARTIHEAR